MVNVVDETIFASSGDDDIEKGRFDWQVSS